MIPKIGDIIKHNACHSEIEITTINESILNRDTWILSYIIHDPKNCEVCISQGKKVLHMHIPKKSYGNHFRKRPNEDTEIL